MRYLLIDSATPMTQVIVLEDGKIISAKSLTGNSVDNISVLTKINLSETGYSFDDFDGMIFCGGPGSALGLRAALISIKTWMVFSKKFFKLLEYCSLNMCAKLNPEIKSIFTYGVGENVVFINNNGTNDHVQVVSYDDFSSTKNAAILNTRYVASKKFESFKQANYNISEANFSILSICKESNGELKDYGSNDYKKWSPVTENETR